jgi:hypothetical protein
MEILTHTSVEEVCVRVPQRWVPSLVPYLVHKKMYSPLTRFVRRMSTC